MCSLLNEKKKTYLVKLTFKTSYKSKRRCEAKNKTIDQNIISNWYFV